MPPLAAARAADFILRHQVYKSHRTGEVGNPKWLELRYPPYWRYDVVQGMLMLSRAAALPDPRASDAAAWLRSQQGANGQWRLSGSPMWKPSGKMYRDPARWERQGASQMLTPTPCAPSARRAPELPNLFLTGTLLNVAAVLVGTTIGLLVGSRMPARMQTTLTDGLGLFVVALGLAGILRVLLDPRVPARPRPGNPRRPARWCRGRGAVAITGMA